MKKEEKLKLLGYVLVLVVVLNLVLFAFRVIDWKVFLVVLGLGFIFSKWGLGWLRERIKD